MWSAGNTAVSVDFAGYLGSRLPYFFGAVLLFSFILLMAVFRSVVVPLKAVILNLLSIGAAYGVVVAIFQWGWGASLIGLGRAGPIEPWAPMMLFAIVFGLSMDYEVFLLSRIREEYDRTHDNATAVADGLASTARVITAAALVMVCVFASFVLGDQRAIKLFGLGLAVAVLIDATWSACSSCRPPWSCWATATGGCPSGSTGSSRSSTSTGRHTRLPPRRRSRTRSWSAPPTGRRSLPPDLSGVPVGNARAGGALTAPTSDP